MKFSPNRHSTLPAQQLSPLRPPARGHSERGQLVLTCLRRSELLTYPTGRHKTKYQCLAVGELDNLIPPGTIAAFVIGDDRATLWQSHNER